MIARQLEHRLNFGKDPRALPQGFEGSGAPGLVAEPTGEEVEPRLAHSASRPGAAGVVVDARTPSRARSRGARASSGAGPRGAVAPRVPRAPRMERPGAWIRASLVLHRRPPIDLTRLPPGRSSEHGEEEGSSLFFLAGVTPLNVPMTSTFCSHTAGDIQKDANVLPDPSRRSSAILDRSASRAHLRGGRRCRGCSPVSRGGRLLGVVSTVTGTRSERPGCLSVSSRRARRHASLMACIIGEWDARETRTPLVRPSARSNRARAAAMAVAGPRARRSRA